MEIDVEKTWKVIACKKILFQDFFLGEMVTDVSCRLWAIQGAMTLPEVVPQFYIAV